jgi:hypothetical protein
MLSKWLPFSYLHQAYLSWEIAFGAIALQLNTTTLDSNIFVQSRIYIIEIKASIFLLLNDRTVNMNVPKSSSLGTNQSMTSI